MSRTRMNLPPVPTPAEERAWFTALRDTDTSEPQRRTLRDRLILGNMGLVWAVVHESMLDEKWHEHLASFLVDHLIRCVDKFDLVKDFRFNTYAMKSMSLKARGYVKRHENLIHVPAWVVCPSKAKKAEAGMEDFFQCRDRALTLFEITDGRTYRVDPGHCVDVDALKAAHDVLVRLPEADQRAILAECGFEREPEELHEARLRADDEPVADADLRAIRERLGKSVPLRRNPDALTVRDVTFAYSASAETVRAWLESGELPFTQHTYPNKCRRIKRADLERFLEARGEKRIPRPMKPKRTRKEKNPCTHSPTPVQPPSATT